MLVSLGRDIQFDAAERHTRLLLQNNRIPGPRLHDFRLTAITIRQRGWIDHLTLLRIPGHETMANLTRFNSYRAPDLQLLIQMVPETGVEPVRAGKPEGF